MITTASFLVASNNSMRIPMKRALGEEGYFKMAIEQASKEKFWPGWFARMAPAFFHGLLALFLFFLFRTPDTWGFWVAFGIVGYVLAYLIHGTRSYIRFRKLGRLASDTR
jgi:hypothetical protein